MVIYTPYTAELLLWGIWVHLVADFILQNAWMNKNKTNLKHPGAWVHSGIHTILLLSVFPPLAAILLGVSHLLIDTRKPLMWWRKIYHQDTEGPAFISFAMWQDQVLHFFMLGLAARIVGAW